MKVPLSSLAKIVSLFISTTLFLTACDQSEISSSTADNQMSDTAHPEQVYWGDTHLHTSNSIDAFGFGNRLDAETALRFARGEEVTSTRGIKAKLSRPLDFLVIADHSEGLGVTKELFEAPRLLVRDPFLRRWWDLMHESEEGGLQVTTEIIDGVANGTLPEALTNEEEGDKRTSKLWKKHNKTLARYNEPGKFTAFSGFEYSSLPQGNNLHRVVMFRDDMDRTNTIIPFSSNGNINPEKLWAWMKTYEASTGGKVLAMPHNSNVSNGQMFAMEKMDGTPIDLAYAQTRAKYEPVVEVTQIKGDSESHPFLSPNDEFAGFGDDGWELCNLNCSLATEDKHLAGSYAREALKNGLALEKKIGANPYAFGMAGATDSHTSLATAAEDNFYGKHSANEIDVEDRAIEPQNLGSRKGRFGWHYLASGYAAAWATSNSREAIFDAFQRREVYATTGPRIRVRVFGGFNFGEDELQADITAAGYSKGVPMGGEIDLSQKKEGSSAAPQLLINALMDPDSGNLDRVQVIKGWIDEAGNTHEKIYNVAWSEKSKRPLGADGKILAIQSTVNLEDGTWLNSVGTPELKTLWTDPDFDPNDNAFYYVRVLEIPTPTWALLDSIKYKFQLPEVVVKIQQERAYTSPIWYKTKP